MCAPGQVTQAELKAMCMQACQAKVALGQECKVCGSATGQIVLVSRHETPLCCGTSPGDPPVPFLKNIGGDVVTTLDGDIEMNVANESATTSTNATPVSYALSNCSGSVCDITFTSIVAEPANFQLGGHSFSEVFIENAHPFSGRIDLTSSLFVVPAGAMTLYTYFVHDDKLNSMDMTNSEPIVGFASTSANAFRFTGSASGEIDDTAVSITLSLNGTFENKGPPIAQVSPTQTVECTSPAGARVQLDASGSTDPDGDALRYFWYEANDQIADGVTPSIDLSLGVHDITLTALDAHAESRASTQITVTDTTGPALVASASPTCLWPPNQKLVRLALGSAIVASTADSCDGAPGSVYIANVTSNDPTATADDIRFGPTATCLRAERSGSSAGRQYTITLSSVDATGNVGSTNVVVEVPRNYGPGCSNFDRSLVHSDTDPACNF